MNYPAPWPQWLRGVFCGRVRRFQPWTEKQNHECHEKHERRSHGDDLLTYLMNESDAIRNSLILVMVREFRGLHFRIQVWGFRARSTEDGAPEPEGSGKKPQGSGSRAREMRLRSPRGGEICPEAGAFRAGDRTGELEVPGSEPRHWGKGARRTGPNSPVDEAKRPEIDKISHVD